MSDTMSECCCKTNCHYDCEDNNCGCPHHVRNMLTVSGAAREESKKPWREPCMMCHAENECKHRGWLPPPGWTPNPPLPTPKRAATQVGAAREDGVGDGLQVLIDVRQWLDCDTRELLKDGLLDLSDIDLAIARVDAAIEKLSQPKVDTPLKDREPARPKLVASTVGEVCEVFDAVDKHINAFEAREASLIRTIGSLSAQLAEANYKLLNPEVNTSVQTGELPALVHLPEDFARAAAEGIKRDHPDYWASMREITRERQLTAALEERDHALSQLRQDDDQMGDLAIRKAAENA